jgi:hypothetical protein
MHRNGIIMLMVLVILAGIAAGMCLINSCPGGVRYEDGITTSKGTVITPEESRLRAEHFRDINERIFRV